MWWKEQNEATRGLFRSLVKENRLEIVLGGWVMPDEANCDYWAMVDSLIEGHQWVEENIGVKPTNSWSIDPFGHSSTMAYLLKRSGFHNMLVQRIHYEMKRMLAESKSLEFRWQQMWDSQGTTAMNAHMMPFFSYDVPHTCGPQPKICCQFDFARSPGFKDHCPWGIAPVQISPSNVAQRAQVLLDQYKKKSQLYRTRNVLVPLGDDFRWDSTKEINMQLTNYRQLMKHMNGNPDMHVEVRWATLSDYFAAVKQDHGHKPDEGDTQWVHACLAICCTLPMHGSSRVVVQFSWDVGSSITPDVIATPTLKDDVWRPGPASGARALSLSHLAPCAGCQP